METLTQQIRTAGNKVYGQVNRMWLDKIPPITKEEAFKAYKLLTRKFGSKKVWSEYYNKWENKKLYIGRRRPRRCWICLSGNCNLLDRGWRRLVHDVSHRVYDFRFPKNSEGHNIAQAKIEHEMAQYVIAQGWLEGKLKPKIKTPLTKDEKKSKKLLNYERLLKKWMSKMSLANTKIKIYKRRIKNLK